MIGLAAAAIALAFLAIAAFAGAFDSTSQTQQKVALQPNVVNASSGTGDLSASATASNPTSVSLSAVGDNLMHIPVVNTADATEGTMGDKRYDFTVLYEGIRDIVETHDINFIDIETPMGGDEKGVSGYPIFNTPSKDAADIADFGFNLASTATNHAWDQGFEGIQSMAKTWAQHPEVIVSGTFTSQEDRDRVRTFEKNGLTCAFLAYQDFLNGFDLPATQSWAVADSNDTEQVIEDIKKAHEQAEFVIVAMSWGDEYETEPNELQRKTAQLFADHGVDLVLGFGPHVPQPVEWVEGTDDAGNPTGKKTLVVYSLGNFVSNQQNDFSLVEGCFTCDIARDDTGVVTIEDPTWIPLVCHFSKGTGHRVYQYKDYTEELARTHDILGSLEDPLGYARDFTEEIIDPTVVTLDF